VERAREDGVREEKAELGRIAVIARDRVIR
jgi:hypothetical protein